MLRINPIYTLQGDENDKKRLGALCRVLSVLVLKLRGENIKDVKPVADRYVDDARLFLRSIGADQKLFNNMYGIMLRKPADVQPLALEFVKDLRDRLRKTNLMNDLDKVSVHHSELIKPLLTLLSTPESASAYSTLLKRVAYLKEPEIQARFIKNFTETKDNSQTVYDQIAGLVQKATGRKDSIALTTEENKKFKAGSAAKAELAGQISKLRSQYSEAVNQEMKQIILDSGKERLPIAQVLNALAKAGVKKMPFPDEFYKSKHIYVNLNAEMCDINGDPLTLQRVQPGFAITFNDKYDPKDVKGSGNTWIYKWTNPARPKEPGFVYTKDRAATNKQEKFAKLDDVITTGELETKKQAWRRRMSLKYDDPDTVFAFLTEYIYETSSRIGSGAGGNTGGKTTFGASNFPVKSVGGLREGGKETKLRIAYLVKGGHKETFFLDPSKPNLTDSDRQALRKLIAFIDAKCKGKKPSDPVFAVGGKRINGTAYGSWLQGKCNLTPHNFRTLRGTELALEYLPEAEKKVESLRKRVPKGKRLADKEIDRVFMDAMMKVGKALGHIRRNAQGEEESTANTAIAYYCSPSVMVDWYQRVGKAPPSTVVRAAANAKLEL